MTKRSSYKVKLPTRDEILEFIARSDQRVGRREVARAFNIKGAAKIGLKRLLREMKADGLLGGNTRGRKTGRDRKGGGRMTKVGVAQITGRDMDGELVAKPANWNEDEHGPAPRIVVAPANPQNPAMTAGVGDRILARFIPLEADGKGSYQYEARIIRRIGKARETAMGILRRRNGEMFIEPVDKKRRYNWNLASHDLKGAKPGDLVSIELARRSVYGQSEARILKGFGPADTPRSFSLIAVEEQGIPYIFPDRVIAESEAAKPAPVKGREDLRHIPLVTMDPQDARDHDDAVWAAPDEDPKNPGGHIVMVAIADVAHYVRPGSALDKEAFKRGNSVYFPDRVIPMLPERISNDLCSLREGEDRPALAVRMVFDKQGKKRSHRFIRALIRSAAKLSYTQAQTAMDGAPDAKAAPLLETVLKPLWAAYGALARARDERQPLDLDLPERKISLDDEGNIIAITTPERLEAHRLIEEMMIQANICAAETLEEKKCPALYRIHDAPSEEKLRALGEFLRTLDIKLARGQGMRPSHFNAILAKTANTDKAELVSLVVLRSQAQAVYSPENHGHFGLNLRRYSHFTSPIRRYADLITHRGLIKALGMGNDGIDNAALDDLENIAREISNHERRAMAAERDTIDRLIASYLQDQLGASFSARISGVTRAGLFLRLAGTGADGLLPISKLEDDYYVHEEHEHALRGERTGNIYRLGDEIKVRLVEAAPVRGALRFELLESREKNRASAHPGARRGRRPHPKRRRRR